MSETVYSLAKRIKDAVDDHDDRLPAMTSQQIAALAVALHRTQRLAQSELLPIPQRQWLKEILVHALADGQYLPGDRSACKVLCKRGQLEPNDCMGYRITKRGREAIGL